MKWFVAVLVVGFVVSVGIAADDNKAELKKFEGDWEITSMEVAGKKIDLPKGTPGKLVIKDGKLTMFADGKEVSTFKDLKLEIVPNKKPKAVELVREGKDTLPCIYELTADELKIAMPMVPTERKPGELLPRPESFDGKDKPVMVLTSKRSKG